MRIGIITNLQNIKGFLSDELAFANTERWMSATGGNTGNVAFVEGVKRLLSSESCAEVSWGDNPKVVNEKFSILVVCCANQIGAHADLGSWYDRLKQFDLPALFIGLGAQSDKIGQHPEIPQGTLKFLELTKDLRTTPEVPNIVTRGEFTSEVLKLLGIDSYPFGCPSQFISMERDVGARCFEHQNSSKHFRVLTAAGNPWHHSYVLERQLVELVNSHNGDYVLQHPASMIQLALNEEHLIGEAQRQRLEKIYGFLGDWASICDWFRSHGVLFADAQNWMQYSKRFTLAIGPRYHGVALPIQAGVPGKVIAIDSRTEELASTTGIPFLKYKDIEKMSAEELLNWCCWREDDASHYDAVRAENASNYVKYFESNKIHVNQKMKSLSSAL